VARKPPKVTASLRIDPGLLETLDAIAERTGETRSVVAERAIEVGLGAAGEFLSQFDAGTKAEILRLASMVHLADGLFGGTEAREQRAEERRDTRERRAERAEAARQEASVAPPAPVVRRKPARVEREASPAPEPPPVVEPTPDAGSGRGSRRFKQRRRSSR
jgi:hypothetical protein